MNEKTKMAVIQTGGKQYLVKSGQSLKIEKLNVKNGEKITFDKVLLLIDEKEVKIGNPYVSGVKVVAESEGETRGEKVKILKYKQKTRSRIKRGYRQTYSKIKILQISNS